MVNSISQSQLAEQITDFLDDSSGGFAVSLYTTAANGVTEEISVINLLEYEATEERGSDIVAIWDCSPIILIQPNSIKISASTVELIETEAFDMYGGYIGKTLNIKCDNGLLFQFQVCAL